MKVKWHGRLSTKRDFNGGDPQGSSFGIWEYLSQSNDNAECVDVKDRFKFVDDLSFIDIIYLLNAGITTYNIHAHVPSNISTHNQIIPSDNIKTQQHLENINQCTKNQKMRLNEKKTKSMIFNFSKKHQFTTKLEVNKVNIEIVKEAKLLGTKITDDLSWNKNTKELVKKAFRRMQLLFKVAKFTNSKEDLKMIYTTYIRSVIEQSAVVWHSSLSAKNRKDLERVQKAAIKVILGRKYTTYKDGLKLLKIDDLETRRKKLCLSFAKKCVKHEKVKDMFPLTKSMHQMKKRTKRKYQNTRTNTNRYKKSTIPYMTSLLNNDYAEKCSIIQSC